MQKAILTTKKLTINLVQSNQSVTKTFQSFKLNAKLFNVLNELGILNVILNPASLNVSSCKDLSESIQKALVELVLHPDHYKSYCPEVGTASYQFLLTFLKSYAFACKNYPYAKIKTSLE